MGIGRPTLVVLAAYLMVQAVGACAADSKNAPEAYPRDVTLSSGKQVHVLAVGPLYFRDPATPPALMVSYETSLKVSDLDALRAEVADIWTDFRKQADDGKFNAAVIAAQEKAPAGIISQSKGYRFVFERKTDGTWPDKPRK